MVFKVAEDLYLNIHLINIESCQNINILKVVFQMFQLIDFLFSFSPQKITEATTL